MFRLQGNPACKELSTELLDKQEWHPGTLRSFSYPLEISAFAVDPVSGLFAIGSADGSIKILGGPAVEVRLKLPSGVKFIQFGVSAFKLVAIDEQDRLCLWDLSAEGQPKLQKTMSFREPVVGITTSPSHAHVFVNLRSGEVKLFDMLCVRQSPYYLPNMWATHEQKMLTNGSLVASRINSRLPVDLVLHPRDLSMIFLAFDGGVVLCDISQRSIIRTFALDPSVHQHISVTAVAVHPTGHLFAVGYADGSIGFWATDDGDRPLLRTTLDEEDVGPTSGSGDDREPIFKLSWSTFSYSSDPRGGNTALVILGGLRADECPGVTALWLPAFNPPEPPATPVTTAGLHPFFREVMCRSVVALKRCSYTTITPVQDFLLIPVQSPHFAGTLDANAIVLLSEAEGKTRSLEARVFPPPDFLEKSAHRPSAGAGPVDVEDELAATLAAMKFSEDPALLPLPSPLWSGSSAVGQAQLYKLERDAHEKFIFGAVFNDLLQFDGGVAWVDETHETKLTKWELQRVLVTRHDDSTIRFQDLGAQYLVAPDATPLQAPFPRPLPNNTVDVLSLLGDPGLSRYFPPEVLCNARVASVQLATEALDLVVTLETGEVIVYKLKNLESGTFWEGITDDMVCLSHLPTPESQHYRPAFMLAPGRGPVSAFSISDIGFLAVAYGDESLFVCDMRGPAMLIREVPEKSSKAHKRGSILHRSPDHDPVVSLSWTVCGIKGDLVPRVRLLATRGSGVARIYTINPSRPGVPSSFIASTQPVAAETVPQAFSDPDSSVVFESRTALRSKADRHGFAFALDPQAMPGAKGGDKHWIWVAAGAKGARANFDVTGDRVGKVEWGSKVGTVKCARVVERSDALVLVAFTERCEALVYSLPYLELMHSVHLPYPYDSIPQFAPDTTGDYILSTMHPRARKSVSEMTYGSLFDIRRSFYALPSIDLGANRRTVPPQPQPVNIGPSSLLGSLTWYVSGAKIMTGDEVDALLGGADRPVPKPKPSARDEPTRGAGEAGAARAAPGAGAGLDVNAVGQQIGQNANAIYGRLTNALAERGEMLDDLQHQFNSLQQGSQNMVNQAKQMAAKQTARSWLGF